MTKDDQPVRPLHAKRLKNFAYFYLGRYSSSQQGLREVLKRRIWRQKKRAPTEDLSWCDEAIEKIISDAVKLGLIDDENFGLQKARGVLSRGKGIGQIRQVLKQKGIDAQTSEKVLQSLVEEKGEDMERQAALHLCRKKKIGPYRNAEKTEPKDRQREMAMMMRYGFSYDLARDVLGLTSDEVDEF